MKKKQTWIVLAVVVLIAVAAVWGGMRYRANSQVANVKALGEQAFQAEGDARRAAWDQFREASESLSESQRDAMRQDFMKQRMAERMAEIDNFFAMDSKAERDAFLDERIQEMEERRQQFEEMRRQREAEGNQGGPGQAGRNGDGRGPGQGRGGSRNDFISRIYDNTTPDQRAKFNAFREAFQQRREELGLPPMKWGRPGRPGGGRPRA